MKTRVLIPAAAGIAVLAMGLLLAEQTLLYEKESQFNHIFVTEDDVTGIRYLLFEEGGAIQSAVKPGDPDHLQLAYARVVPVGLTLVDEPAKALVIGLGGATIPAFLHKHYPKMRIDAVDIDPEVIEVARAFFGFKEDSLLKSHAADGRKFIEETKERYDLVVLDAYSADSVPYSLTTKEFLAAVKKVLTPKGVVVGNIWSRTSNPLYDSMLRTYQDVFDEMYLFEVERSSNRIVIALPRKGKTAKEDFIKKAAEFTKKYPYKDERDEPFDLGKAVAFGYQYATDLHIDAPVLTDSK